LCVAFKRTKLYLVVAYICTCDRVAMLQLEICKFLAGDLVSYLEIFYRRIWCVFLLFIDVFLLFVSVLNQLHPISIYIVYISVLLMNEGLDGIDKPQKCRNVCYHPTHQQQSYFFNFSALWLYCLEHSVFIVIALL
jgi:hypothetical protein